MNITEELNSSKAKERSFLDNNSTVEQFKLLETQEAQEDLRIAKALGSGNSIMIAQTRMGNLLEIESLDRDYKGGVVHIKEIEKLCIKYRLRFLRSKHFTGHLDIEAIARIKEFSKETGVPISDGNLERKFYVMAPASEFKLRNLTIPFPGSDPILFYKLDENHYRIIHKWGNDMNVLRFFYALTLRSPRAIWNTFIGTILLVAALVGSFISYVEPGKGWTAILAAFLVIGSIISLVYRGVWVDGLMNFLPSNRNWNSEEIAKYG